MWRITSGASLHRFFCALIDCVVLALRFVQLGAADKQRLENVVSEHITD
jgi:hypothetical protein